MDESHPEPLITRLVPILYVRDLNAERSFYETLGFTVTYEGTEYPEFIAIGCGSVEFGLERREDFDGAQAPQVLIWQLGVSSVDAAAAVCQQAGIACALETHEPGENWRYRTLRLRSPNGFEVLLEGPRE